MRLLALPAELYPQIKGCAEYFLFNFSEGCVTASTGLPAELYPQIRYSVVIGGDKRDRTADLLNAIQALSQLSYTPR